MRVSNECLMRPMPASGREFEFDEERQVIGRDVRVRESGHLVLLQPRHVQRTQDPHDRHPRLGVEDVVQDSFEVEPFREQMDDVRTC